MKNVVAKSNKPTTPKKQKSTSDKRLKKLKRYKGLLSLIVFALLVVLVVNTGSFSFKGIGQWVSTYILGENKGSGYPVSLDDMSVNGYNFTQYSKNVLYLSDNSLVKLNINGGVMNKKQHSYNSPVLVTDGDNYLLFDRGGKKYSFQLENKDYVEKKTEEKIISATISDTGYYAISTTQKGYLSKLTLFDSNQTELFSWSSPNYYITNIAISEDKKHISAIGINSLDGVANSEIFVFDIKNPEIKTNFSYKNCILNDIVFNGNYLCVLGDNISTYIDINGGENFNKYEIENRNIVSFEQNKNGYTLLSTSTESGQSHNLILLKNSEEVFNKSLQGNSSDVYLGNNYIVSLSTNNATILNYKGDVLSTIDIETGAISCFIIKDNLYVLNENSIEKYNCWN